MQFSYRSPIWLYTVPIDFRKQIDGLVLIVVSVLTLSPVSGELFIFRNRTANKIKLLWYDGSGFWLCYKRLERGRLLFPKQMNDVCELSRDQLSWLLSGLDFTKQKTFATVNASQFY